jgi:murein DD-endopeptidase MepM/ murein hydrolase activator NlpD
VTPGDTLSEIAARTGLAVPAIVAANSLANPDLLTVGQQLVLPAAPRPAARPRPAPSRDRGPATLAAPVPATLVWPVQGPITTFFGEVGPSSPRGHTGLDISAHWGMPVRAATSGRVLTAGDLGDGYGIQVLVQQSSHFQARYAHLSHLAVSVGDAVAQDQVIGLVGSTGFSTGAHLHFEVLVDGIPRDPLSYLP